MERTGETNIEAVYNKIWLCLERGLIENSKDVGSKTCGKVYSITDLGLLERRRFTDHDLTLHREVMADLPDNYFVAGHYRKLANWKAILAGMLGKGWVRTADILEAIDFYKKGGGRKALREMTAEGLLEVTSSAIHKKIKIYRTTDKAADFVDGCHA